MFKRAFKKLYNLFSSTSETRFLFARLKNDAELQGILDRETHRQQTSLELIASENYTSISVLEANGTIFTNKYSEGYPNRRYYGGNEHIDELEILCQDRALKAFNLNTSVWGVNVQSYSGSTANFAVYTGLLQPGDKIMGLDLPSGGHLSHGYQTPRRKISNSSKYFTSLPYIVDKTGFIDIAELERRADNFAPNLIIVGASAYPRDFDYSEFRRIADKHNAYLMADIAHISGFVASGLMNNPFDVCDIVTTTTHKTLRGPRAALIFYKKELKDAIDSAVFPGTNGGPHNNTIAAVAAALKQVNTKEFQYYATNVKANAKVLARTLQSFGFDIVTGGTDNHIVLIDLTSKNITGSKFEKIAEMCNISLNKNAISTDTSPLNPSGIRLGTSAMTSRGFTQKHWKFVGSIIDECCNVALEAQERSNSKQLHAFVDVCENDTYIVTKILVLRNKVSHFCKSFPLPTK